MNPVQTEITNHPVSTVVVEGADLSILGRHDFNWVVFC